MLQVAFWSEGGTQI